jgi:lipopolysaccharide export system protein LptA
LFLLVSIAVFGQKKSVIDLIRSDHAEGVKINGKDLIKVYKGVFKQDYSVLTSDSAYFYPKENAFDAFGHVNINQGDTLNIYSDKLNYNGNTKIAILTDHVRMVDKDATLFTDYLTYNTATRFGTYTGGGKLINKDNVLTSKNGYYYAFTRDSYFRYNVVLTTPDVLIKTDTLRYNTGSRIAYFYGPTDIYGTTGPKTSRDTLYTENGTYNTVTEQAFFGKNNLYRQGTKTLKGDSLFYDKLKGFGKAVKRVTFNDTEQKMTLKGDLGTYFKPEERTVMTENAYGTLVTEETDTTKSDSAKVKMANKAKGKDKTTIQKVDSVFAAKSLISNKTDAKEKPNPDKKEISVVKRDSAVVNKPELSVKAVKPKKNGNSDKKTAAKADTARAFIKPARKTKLDTIYYTADTLETQIVTYKDYKILKENARLAGLPDSTGKIKAALRKKNSKLLFAETPNWFPQDTSYFHRDFFGKPKPAAPRKAGTGKKSAPLDKYRQGRTDSVYAEQKVELSDTTRIRILMAFRHAKLYKSDLQAKADSIFYSASDSTIRCYVHPMIWTQGSQLSGDTIYLQMKNKKLDNMSMFPNAFIANVEKGDSINFNQVAGKKMRGYFYDGKLNKMFIDGNAESIYFSRDSLGKLNGMQRSLSSQIRVNLKDGQVTQLTFFTKPENQYGPPAKLKEDDKVLKSFIWKPKDRPASKESIIPSLNKKPPVKAIAAKGSSKGNSKAPLKTTAQLQTLALKGILKQTGLINSADSLKNTALPALLARDTSAIKANIKNIPLPLVKKDSVKKQ